MNRWWLRAAQLLLLALVGWGIYRALAPELARVRLEDLLAYRPEPVRLVVSTVLLLLVYIIHAWLWRQIAVALSGSALSIRPAMRVYFLSGLGRYLPGKLWQMAGMAVLAQRAGFSPVAVTAASLVGQLAYLTTGIIFLALLLPSMLEGAAALAAAVLVAMGAMVFLVVATERGKALRHRLFSRFGERVARAGALLDRLNVRSTTGWWLWYGVSWLVMGAAFAVFVTAFVPAQPAQFRDFAGIAVASYVIGYIGFTPAGIGVREGIMMTLLAATLPVSAALLISVLSRVWFTAAELIPLLLIPVLPRDRASEKTT